MATLNEAEPAALRPSAFAGGLSRIPSASSSDGGSTFPSTATHSAAGSFPLAIKYGKVKQAALADSFPESTTHFFFCCRRRNLATISLFRTLTAYMGNCVFFEYTSVHKPRPPPIRPSLCSRYANHNLAVIRYWHGESKEPPDLQMKTTPWHSCPPFRSLLPAVSSFPNTVDQPLPLLHPLLHPLALPHPCHHAADFRH